MEKRNICDFEVKEVIGEGSLGIVCRGIEKENGRVVAIKQISKSTVVKFGQVENIKREKENLFYLRGVNFIIELYYTFQDRHHLCLFINCEKKSHKFLTFPIDFVMEYVSEGDLLSKLQKKKKISEEEIRQIGSELVIALEVLQKNVINLCYFKKFEEN